MICFVIELHIVQETSLTVFILEAPAAVTLHSMF